MVYASVPAYLDPPNWNQQSPQQQQHQAHLAASVGNGTRAVGDGGAHHQQLLGSVPPRTEGGGSGGGGGGGITATTIRPGSMADRARLAKIPQPEAALKCPRCDSTNTKFCYFNNYSLSQPRHFCKSCRRYWTRGGALRNVPVGGGCRRNKRSKSGSSKSSSVSISTNVHTSAAAGGATVGVGAINPHMSASAPQLPFMTSLHPLSDYGSIGLNYGGLQTINDAVDQYNQVASSSGSGMGLEQWRLQQFQQLPLFEQQQQQTAATPALGLYPFDGKSGVEGTPPSFAHGKGTAAGLITQLASVKMEQGRQGLNFPRQYLGNIAGNDGQYWGGSGGANGAAAGSGSNNNPCGGGGSVTDDGGGWTADISGFNSTTTGNLL